MRSFPSRSLTFAAVVVASSVVVSTADAAWDCRQLTNGRMLRFAADGKRYRAGPMAAERIKRLKDLVDRLERLPASDDRDRVLREVRSRAVDVDTGVTPRAMRPVREPIAPRVVAPRRPAHVAKTVVPAAKDHEEWFPIDERLSLEDTPSPVGVQAVPPWTLGLRG